MKDSEKRLYELSNAIGKILPEDVTPILLLGALGRVATAAIKSMPVPTDAKINVAKGFGETLLSTIDPDYSREMLVQKLTKLASAPQHTARH